MPPELALIVVMLVVIVVWMYASLERSWKESEKETKQAVNQFDNILNDHLAILKRQRRILIYRDQYGVEHHDKWIEEKKYFLDNVVAPKTGLGFTNAEPLRSLFLDEIDRVIKESDDENTLSDEFDTTDPIGFEKSCAETLRLAGWVTSDTARSGDQGADIIATKDSNTVALQCKLYSSPVGNKAVQEASAAKDFYQADVAVVVTNNTFTRSAKTLAQKVGVILMHYSELGQLEELIRKR